MKRNLLSILSMLFLGISANAQTIVYSNEFTTAPVLVGSGAFTYASDGSNWTITAPTGHGEWDEFDIVFSSPLNFATIGNKPIVSIKASTTQNVAFQVLLVDDKGRMTDKPLNLADQPLIFNIKAGEAVKEFSYNFTGQFEDFYGNAGAAQGIVDSTKIARIRFKINPGWKTCACSYHHGLSDSADYKLPLSGSGTITIDKLQIGAALSAGVELVNSSSLNVYPNPSTGLVNVTLANPNSDMLTVCVSNVLGQEIYSSNTNQSNLTIDLTGKNTGVYYISVKSLKGITTQRLFLN